MPPEIIEKFQDLEAQKEDLLSMHFAAMRVLDSTTGGGWGSFRVDGLTKEQAERLPDYINEYVGEVMPRLYYDDEGYPQVGGGSKVTEDHTKFTLVISELDEEPSKNRMIFRWNEELWNPEVAEAIATKEAKEARKKRTKKQLAIAGMGALGLAIITSFTGMVYGSKQVGELKEQGAPQEEIDDAYRMVDGSMVLIIGGACVSGTAYIGLTISEIRKVNKKSKK